MKMDQQANDRLKSRKNGVCGGVTPMPWRNEKSLPVEEVDGAAELVQHITNVPGYLQGVERVDRVQRKVLNFGVIDRERLEKWAYDQKPAVDRRGGDSVKHTRNSSSESCSSKRVVEEDYMKNVIESFDSRTSRILHASLKLHQFSDQSDHDDTTDRRTISSSSSQCGDISISTSTSEDFEAVAFEYNRQKFQNYRFKEAEKLHSYSPVNCCRRLSSVGASEQEQYPSKIEVPSSKSKGDREKYGHCTEKLVVDVPSKSAQDVVHTTTMEVDRRLPSSHRLGASLNWTRRSSTVRNDSSVEHTKCTPSSVDSHGEKQNENNRGRASPFRRMLDPLSNSKNRFHSPGPVASSPLKDSSRSSFAERPCMKEESTPRRRSFHTTMSFFSSQGKDNSNSSSKLSTSSSYHSEKQETWTSQARLQLSWKDGLPLFTLSSNDSNILAATLSNGSICDKGNLECIYTILSIHEVKKKSGLWMNQGNKNKKHGFFSNVIGHLNVSSAELERLRSEDDYAVKEFVLFGAELLQESHEPVTKNELAAIVIKMPKRRADGSYCGLVKNGYCNDSSQVNSAKDECHKLHLQSVKIQQNPEYMRLSTIAVILPSGVHGFSTASEPSTLIKRWKSGGQCDCGGWDEGCKLTILTDDVHDNKGSGSDIACNTGDYTNEVKLIVQCPQGGGSQDNRHSFSMSSLKEGVYVVDFGASISSLQAFAICLATLHSRKYAYNSSMQGLVVARNSEEESSFNYIAGTKDDPLTGYVPQHPPLSPVGRA